MEALLTYILQVNLLLSLLYIGYYTLLKSLTFYQLNRTYLLLGAIYAFVYPFIDFRSWLEQEVLIVLPLSHMDEIWWIPQEEEVKFTLIDTIIYIVFSGVALFTAKFVLQLISLRKIHVNSKPGQWKNYFFRNVFYPIVPFSFINQVYLHQQQHQEVELQDIFEHEYIHVKGRHTFDILLFEIIWIGCWYNPFVWLMRRAVRENLEFLTDHQVLNKGVDRQAYQYSLLNVTKQGTALGLGNQFNFKTLKKRIMMMNKKRSSKLEWSKYAFLLPILVVAGASFTVSKAESGIEKVVEKAKETTFITENEFLNYSDKILDSNELAKLENLNADKFYKYDIIDQQKNNDSVGYVLDDKLVSIDDLKLLDAKDFESVVVNFDNDLTKKYGKKSIVNIKTKKFAGTVGSPNKFESITFNDDNFEISGGKLVYVTDNLVSNNELSKKDKPLVVIDDKVQDASFDLNRIDPNTIHSVSVLKDQSATALYGDKGKKGVVLIVTKPFNESNINYNDNIKGSIVINKKSLEGVQVKVNAKDSSNLKFGPQNTNAKPLIVVDGVVKGTDQWVIGSINTNDIESINILKDNSAVEKYGDKGKDGVIEFTTKSYKKAVEKLIESENDGVAYKMPNGEFRYMIKAGSQNNKSDEVKLENE